MDGAQVLGLVAIAMLGLCNRDDQEAPRGVSMAPAPVAHHLQGTLVGTIEGQSKCNYPFDARTAPVSAEWVISGNKIVMVGLPCSGATIVPTEWGAIISPHRCDTRRSKLGTVINESILGGHIKSTGTSYLVSFSNKLVATTEGFPTVECDMSYAGTMRKR